MMKDDAILINTSRDGIVRHSALTKALTEGRLYGYASDVHAGEPPKHSPLFDLPNVIVTPHAGSATYEANYRMGMAVADNGRMRTTQRRHVARTVLQPLARCRRRSGATTVVAAAPLGFACGRVIRA